MDPIKIQIRNFFKKFNFPNPKGKWAVMWKKILLFLAILVILIGAVVYWQENIDVVFLVLLGFFIILCFTVHAFTKQLDPQKNQLRILIRWSYFYTIFFLLTGFIPFILLDKSPELKNYLATSPIGVVRGCVEISPVQSNTSIPLAMVCSDQPSSNPGQWLINIGGGVVASSPDQKIAKKVLTDLMAEAEKLDSLIPLQSKLKEINEAWLRFANNKELVETKLISELKNIINDHLNTSLETQKKLMQDLINDYLNTSQKTREKLKQDLESIDANHNLKKESINEALKIIEEMDSKLKEVLASIQMPRTWKIHGGLVAPLYFIVLAIMGAIVSMMRKVPEIQFAETIGDTQKMQEARAGLIFQILQVVSSPMIAVTAFYLVNPANPAGIVTLGFVSGFSSETILLMIRAVSDKMRAGLQEKAKTKRKPKNKPNGV